MYSQQVISDVTAKMEREFKRELHEVPVPKVQEMLDRLSDVWDAEGKPTRRYSAEEESFVVNEMLMSSASFCYFAERYLTVTSKEGGIAPMFPLWSSQEFILQRMAKIEERIHSGEREDGILLNLLKGSRQIGGSTFAEAVIAHRIATQNHLTALIASDKPEDEGSAYLYGMQERMLSNLPQFLRPVITDRQKNREIKTDGGCHIIIGAGKSTRGISGQRGQLGRGITPHLVHLSEVSTWENASQIDDALLNAVPRKPRVFVMLESTAKGRGPENWWHHHWNVSKRSQVSRFNNILIPWYLETSYTLRPPVNWVPSATTLVAARRVEETSPIWAERKITPTRGQLYWYEVTRETASEKGLTKKALEEMLAITDDECFQHSGQGIFSAELIQAITDRARPMVALLDILPRKVILDRAKEEMLAQIKRRQPVEDAVDELMLEKEEASQ